MKIKAPERRLGRRNQKMNTANKSKTDWSKEESRKLLYKALLAKLKHLADENGTRLERPASWQDFLDKNEIEYWGRSSDRTPQELRYRFPDHVWIDSPEGEVAEDDWNDAGLTITFTDYFETLFVPYEFAEKAVKALMLGGAENL